MVIIEETEDKDNLLEKISQFEKYAALLMQRFDVKILFDGSNAYTDGKEIHLPNLLTLSPKEIDLLYGILLHEVGHIHYSEFTGLEKEFAKITTTNQISLVNAIEDARIENKMIDAYGGAKETFDELYNKFACDRKYMAKIFKFQEGVADWWHDFGGLVHNEIACFPIDSKRMVGRSFDKVDALVGKVRKLIKNHPLKSHKDSFALALAIHDVIFKQKNDTSPKLDFAKREKAKEEAEKMIKEHLDEYNKILKENDALLKKLKALRGQRKQLGKQRNEFHDAHKKEYEESEKLQEFADQAEQLQQEQQATEYAKQREEQRLANAQQKEREKQEAAQKREERMKELEKKLAEAKTQSQKERVQKSIEAQKRMQESLKKQIEQAQKEEAMRQQDLSEAQKEAQEAAQKAQGVQGVNPSQMYQEAMKKIEQLEKESQGKFGNQIDQVSNMIGEMQNTFDQAKEGFQKQLAESMKALDAKLKAMGIEGMGLIPEFKQNEDWKDSDQVQQKFDKQATDQTGQPVVNGMSPYGTNVREMTTALTDVSHKLQEINLAEVFDHENHESMVESINEIDAQVTNTRTDEKGETYKSTRRHIPLTTKYDVVREETNSKGQAEINEIRNQQKRNIDRVTAILKAKFKFKQKPKFRSAREEGSLCARDLYQIPQGLSTQIFEELYKKPDSKVRVAIALDISGSMDKEEMAYGRKLKEVAVVLSDSLTAAHVKHEVIGFGAPVNPDMEDVKASKLYNRTMHSLETVVYRNLSGASGLGNIQLQPWDNSDGESLRVVAKRMGKERSKKKIVFVVSDNKPFLTDSDIATLDQDLKNSIIEARKAGIEVYGIGWNEIGKDFYGEKYCNMEKDFESLAKFLETKIQPVK